MNIYRDVAQCEEVCCVYTAVSVAAKAKPWFNLRSHICVTWVDTTRFHGSFFAFYSGACTVCCSSTAMIIIGGKREEL